MDTFPPEIIRQLVADPAGIAALSLVNKRLHTLVGVPTVCETSITWLGVTFTLVCNEDGLISRINMANSTTDVLLRGKLFNHFTKNMPQFLLIKGDVYILDGTGWEYMRIKGRYRHKITVDRNVVGLHARVDDLLVYFKKDKHGCFEFICVMIHEAKSFITGATWGSTSCAIYSRGW